MPVYQYIAKNYYGHTIEGLFEAPNRVGVIYMLKGKNFFPVDIKESKKEFGSLPLNILFGRIAARDLSIFCRQFSTMINAGITVLDSLDILRKQTENSKLRETVDGVFEEVQKGKNLSRAMGLYKDIFPELLVNMVETGEISGALDIVMDRMALHYEKEYRLNQKVKNALLYPIFILIVAALVVAFLVTVILPTFASMFQQMGAVLPLSTRIMMGISTIIKNNWLLLLIFVTGLFLGVKIYISTEAGKKFFDKAKLNLPVIGETNKKIIIAQFARTLSVLLASGISIIQSINIIKKVIGNTVVQKYLSQVEDEIKKGRGLAAPLKNSEFFPPMLIHMVKVGENTGSLDYMLKMAADFYDNEVESAVTRMTTLLEPLIIMGMALIVGFIVVSVVMPMFDFMTKMNF
ncbi:MAG: type II secretion system F family protein [Tepidanaerobacteraceae bacterium]|jgi:type IV pilus assembly protein PilC|nr:type II secretion system F family protein [Tepidanaerobacteraceae bacterium]